MPALTLSKLESHLWEAANILRGPVDAADFIWGQHMIKPMAPKSGRMAVVLPDGALFRMGKEGEIWKRLFGMDLLEAVIGLGPNLFYAAGLAACMLVFRQKMAKDQKINLLTVEEVMKRLRESAAAAFAEEERLIGIIKKEGLLA